MTMRPIEFKNIIKPSVEVLERCGSLMIDYRVLAKFLGIPAKKVGEVRAMGRLPLPCRIGHALRWNVLELLDWVEAGCPRGEVWVKQHRSYPRYRWN